MPNIKNDKLEVAIDDKTLTVSVKDMRTGKLWRMREDGPGDIGVKGHCGPYQTFMFRDAACCEWTTLSETSLQATLTKWPYSANVWSPLSFGLTVKFTVKDADLRVEISPYRQDSHEASIIDSYYPRGFMFPEKSSGDLVLPYAQGCLFDKDSKLDLDMVLPGYVGVGFVMPWWGQLCADGNALVALSDTPDDMAFRIYCDGGRGGAVVHPYWQASLGGFKYGRSMIFRFFDNADVMTLAKAYRKHAEQQGQAITLRDKAAERPAVDSLVGGPLMNIWFMSTFSRFGASSRVNFMRFSEGLRRYKKLCSLADVGRKGFAHIDGWCKDGYDFNHPQPLPPDPRLGSWKGLKNLCDSIKKETGHAFVLHDNYVDYYKHTDAFKNDDGVMNLDGFKHESIEWLGGPQQWLCSTRAQKYLDETCEELAEHGCDINGFYLDCWSIGHLRECYDQRHPATRTQTRRAWSEALAACHNRGMVVGSESGNDWAVPVMDYCHTVQPDAVPHLLVGKMQEFGKSIPLYNMVWHDCLVCPAWINQDRKAVAVIKDGLVVHEKKDLRLWALLWGGPPAFRTKTMCYGNFTEKDYKTDAEFIKSLKPIWEFNGAVGYERIEEWEMLSPDGMAQQSVFSNGAKAEVDFSTGRYKMENGKKKTQGVFK